MSTDTSMSTDTTGADGFQPVSNANWDEHVERDDTLDHLVAHETEVTCRDSEIYATASGDQPRRVTGHIRLRGDRFDDLLVLKSGQKVRFQRDGIEPYTEDGERPVYRIFVDLRVGFESDDGVEVALPFLLGDRFLLTLTPLPKASDTTGAEGGVGGQRQR